MTINGQTTLREMAFIVCTALHQAGETVVLSGGGSATVYAPEAYQSRDLDFIFAFWSSFGVPKKPLLDLDFIEKDSAYHHPESIFTVEFPRGPLAIGDEEITSWNTLEEGDLILHILTPTDCVRDRLAWFIYNEDFSGMAQAVGVGSQQDIDLELIRRWCEGEGALTKFEIFQANLEKGRAK